MHGVWRVTFFIAEDLLARFALVADKRDYMSMPDRKTGFRDPPPRVTRRSPRTVASRARASLAAFIAKLALLAVAAGTADARDVQVPVDPIGPVSKAECDALDARYKAVLARLRSEARAERDRIGWPSAGESILDWHVRTRPHSRRARQLDEQASGIQDRQVDARDRCMTQAMNHLRQDRRREEAGRSRFRVGASGSQPDGAFANTGEVLAGALGIAGYQTLRGAGLAGLQAFRGSGRRYTVGGRTFSLPVNTHAASVAETLFRITEAGSLAFGARSSGGREAAPAGIAFGLEAVDRFSRWNQLRKVLFRASVGLLLNVQTAASADLASAFAAFDLAVSLEGLDQRLTTYDRSEAARYQAVLHGVPAAPAGTLAADLDRHASRIAAIRNERAAPASERLAEAERRRRAAAAEEARRRAAAARRRADERERRWREEEEAWERERMAEQQWSQPDALDAFNDLVNQYSRHTIESYRRWERENQLQQQPWSGSGPRCYRPDGKLTPCATQ